MANANIIHRDALRARLEPTHPNLAFCISRADEGYTDTAPFIQFLTNNDTPATLEILNAWELAIVHFRTTTSEATNELEQANSETTRLRTELWTSKSECDNIQARLEEARNMAGGSVRRRTTDPQPFSGEEKDVAKRQQEFITLLSQAKRCWATDSAVFHNDFLKIQHFAGLLTGDAMELHLDAFATVTDNPRDPSKWFWKETIIIDPDTGPRTITPVTTCCNHLAKQYITLDLAMIAGRAFDNCYMNSRAFQNFSAELRLLGSKCGKTPEQMVEALRMRVSEELSGQVTVQATRPGKTDYDGWVVLYQTLYNNLEEQKHINKLRSRKPAAQQQNKPGQNNNSSTNNKQSQHQHHNQVAQTSAPSGDPMDLSRVQLAADECAYCHQKGHWRNECPERIANANCYDGMPALNTGRGRGGASTGGHRGGYDNSKRGRGGDRGGQRFGGGGLQTSFNNTRGAPPPWANRQMFDSPSVSTRDSDAWTIDESVDLNKPPPAGPQITQGTTFLATDGKYYSEVTKNT